MAIDYQAVLRSPQVRSSLSPGQLAEALEDEDNLHEMISYEGESVLSLGFDTGSVGTGAGVNWIEEWNGLFFFFSSDLDCEGPFETLDEAVALEVFHWPNSYASELDSDRLPFKQLIKIARDVVIEDGQSILINGNEYVFSEGKLEEIEEH
jgi:hypothetical protein